MDRKIWSDTCGEDLYDGGYGDMIERAIAFHSLLHQTYVVRISSIMHIIYIERLKLS